MIKCEIKISFFGIWDELPNEDKEFIEISGGTGCENCISRCLTLHCLPRIGEFISSDVISTAIGSIAGVQLELCDYFFKVNMVIHGEDHVWLFLESGDGD